MADRNFRTTAEPETTNKGEMKATLERRPKTLATKAKTPFDAVASGTPGWLGCELWGSPLSFPTRARCAAEVLDVEKAETARIVREYRENEKLLADNDLGARQNALSEHDTNPFKRLSPERHQQVLREMASINHEQYLAAASNLRALREQALELAQTILSRLVQSFDAELQTSAISAEQRLEQAEIPLSNPSRTDWELWHQNEVIYRHSWRELCRNKLANLDVNNAVGVCQWMASDETGVPFEWLS